MRPFHEGSNDLPPWVCPRVDVRLKLGFRFERRWRDRVAAADGSAGLRRPLPPGATILGGLAVVLLTFATGFAQNPTSLSTRAANSQKVDELMGEWVNRRSPGAAVLVIEDDLVVHCKGYGLANLDAKEATPITPFTTFRLASLTKQFTAMGVMILKERGHLKYGDVVSDLLPEFSTLPEIKVLDLLHHTAGLQEYQDVFEKLGRIDSTAIRAMSSWPRSSRKSHV